MRNLMALVVLGALFAGCGSQAGGPGGGSPGGQATSNGAGATPGAAGGGASLAAAAAKVTDWCALIPNDVVARFAPSAAPAAPGTYPGECGASNGVGALDFRYSKGFGHFETPNPAQVVSGLGLPAFAQSAGVDETQLWVVLEDTADSNVDLFIDVAGHDGKDHLADAVAIAQAILAKLASG